MLSNYRKLILGGLTLLAHLFASDATAQITYNYTGTVQTYTVPAFVFELTIDMAGASGGGSIGTTPGPHNPGDGGRVQTTLSVTPGQVLNLYVGGQGTNGIGGVIVAGGWNGGGNSGPGFIPGPYGGGGGGGASDIRIGGTALGNRVAIAGAGGGAAFNYFAGGDHGGDGGGTVADDGLSGGGLTGPPGKGGTTVAGGAGGLWTGYLAGVAGTSGNGGNGGANGAGGGGGGGYYGGGGGSWAGGGGGSSYTDPALTSGTIHTVGYNTGNGYITITEISVLPIELTEFNGELENENIRLNWTTKSERNNAYFILEHSNDNEKSWHTITTSQGAGNSNTTLNYSTLDTDPVNGLNYYRLTQVDFDGQQESFPPICIYFTNNQEAILFPTVTCDLITVITSTEESSSDWVLIDMRGNTVPIEFVPTSLHMYQASTAALAPGSYLLKTKYKNLRFTRQ